MPPEPQPGQPIDARVTALETGQQSMSERIDRILGLLDKKPADSSGTTTVADPPPGPDMAEQMREAVRAVHAERDQAAAKDTGPKPEVTPREAGQPARSKLAAVLYGKEPKP